MKFKSYGIRGSKPTPLKYPDVAKLITKFLLSSDNAKLNKFVSNYKKLRTSKSSQIEEIRKLYVEFNDVITEELQREKLNLLNFASDTPCIEVRNTDTKHSRGQQVLFDLGTGASHIEILPDTRILHIFFTHFHYDHVQGMLFFGPLYDNNIQIHFYSPVKGFSNYLHELMHHPYFPVTMSESMSKITFHELNNVKKSISINGMKISWKEINHPGGSYGYRVDNKSKSFCYFSDVNITEILFRQTKDNQQFLNGIDTILLDASMLFNDIVIKKNYGHSSFYTGIDFVNYWKIKNAYLFHLDPVDDIARLPSLYQSALWYNKIYNNVSQIKLSSETKWFDV